MTVDISQPEVDTLVAGQADTSQPEVSEVVAPSTPIDPNRPPVVQPAPEEETDEQWRLRFIEENQHLLPRRPERPPAPPPSPWDRPRSSWKVPDHLSMRHPKGGYMAMALMSRTMDDLDEVTKGERAATYEEVDTYLGHALIAEGLVPLTYTADEAIRWWKAGGYKVLGNSATPKSEITLGRGADGAQDELATDDARDMPTSFKATFMVDPDGPMNVSPNPAVHFAEGQTAFDAAMPIEDAFEPDHNPQGLQQASAFVPSEPSPSLAEEVRKLNERRKKLARELENMPSDVANAYADALRGPNARDLTSGEIKRLRKVFGTMIDLSNVKIVNGSGLNPDADTIFRISGNPAITEGNTVYINPEILNGQPAHYRNDFSLTTEGVRTLVHEFYHVLQYQKWGFAKFFYKYGRDGLFYSVPALDKEAVYNYEKRNLAFADETIEGQAKIAGDYAAVRAGNRARDLPKRRALEKRLKGTGIYGL